MSPPNLQVTAWWPKGSRILFGQRAHLDPEDVSMPSHHPSEDPKPGDGTASSQDEVCAEDTESNLALSAIQIQHGTVVVKRPF